jgi:hypothetical protein
MMENTFLICSLPRSRSLWFSHFLTVPGASVCTHEASEFAASTKEFWSNAQHFCSDAGVKIYGNSDSASLFVLPALLAERPLTRVIWIDRPQNEVIASMRANNIPHDFQSVSMMIRLRDIYRDYFDLVVAYDQLQHLNMMKVIWQVAMPDVPFDPIRWIKFERQRIAYGPSNPMPEKDYTKFFEWVQRELSEPVWREW